METRLESTATTIMGGLLLVIALTGACTVDDPVSSPSRGAVSPSLTPDTPVGSGASRRPADVFANVSGYEFGPAGRMDRRPLRQHLRSIAPEAFQTAEVRSVTDQGSRLRAAVAVASYDISPTEAGAFKEQTLTYLEELDERPISSVIFDGNGRFFEGETIAAATFFVGQHRPLLVHVVGRPALEIATLAREIHASNP